MSFVSSDPIRLGQPHALAVRSEGEDAEGACPDCGGPLRRIWGHVDDTAHDPAGATVAVYFVTWMPGRQDHGIAYDLVVGPFSPDATAMKRSAVSFDMRHANGANTLRVVDAAGRLPDQPQLYFHVLSRKDVYDSPRAVELMMLADSIYANDPRLADVRSWAKDTKQ